MGTTTTMTMSRRGGRRTTTTTTVATTTTTISTKGAARNKKGPGDVIDVPWAIGMLLFFLVLFFITNKKNI